MRISYSGFDVIHIPAVVIRTRWKWLDGNSNWGRQHAKHGYYVRKWNRKTVKRLRLNFKRG